MESEKTIEQRINERAEQKIALNWGAELLRRVTLEAQAEILFEENAALKKIIADETEGVKAEKAAKRVG